ncbi:MAG: gamma-glutamyl-phosphate reductase, partial [Acidobacteriales bacterium]
MDVQSTIKKIAEDALTASRRLSHISANTKNAGLLRMADELILHRDFILSENSRDLTGAREKGLSAAMVDRLTVKDATIE